MIPALSGSALLTDLSTQVIIQCMFSSVYKCQSNTCNAKWESSICKRRIHHIMATATDSGRGFGVFNPPPLQCVAVRKRDSYWSPLPLSSSPDFSFKWSPPLHMLPMVLSSSRVRLHAPRLTVHSPETSNCHFSVLVNIAVCILQGMPLFKQLAQFLYLKSSCGTCKRSLEVFLYAAVVHNKDALM